MPLLHFIQTCCYVSRYPVKLEAPLAICCSIQTILRSITPEKNKGVRDLHNYFNCSKKKLKYLGSGKVIRSSVLLLEFENDF